MLPCVSKRAGEPVTDIKAVVPELQELAALAEAGSIAEVVERVLDAEEQLPYGQSSTAASIVSEVPGVEKALEERIAEVPEDAVARTLLAYRQVVIGWDIRTGLRAEHVSAEQFEQFHAWLRRAEQTLIEVCAQYPNWSLPWHVRTISARGLELGHSESRRRYDRLAARHPHHLAAQGQVLQQLCPKWGGTWDAAFAFARQTAQEGPAGSPLAGHIAEAHLERWLEDDTDRYLQDPAVVADLAAAEAASLGHPDYQPGYYDWLLHSLFGVLFALAGDRDRAVPHFRALGDYMDDWVWGYVTGTSRDKVQAVRAVARDGGAAR